MAPVGLDASAARPGPVQRVGKAWAWTFNLAWGGVMVGLFGSVR